MWTGKVGAATTCGTARFAAFVLERFGTADTAGAGGCAYRGAGLDTANDWRRRCGGQRFANSVDQDFAGGTGLRWYFAAFLNGLDGHRGFLDR